MPTNTRMLGEILIDLGCLTEDKLNEALAMQQERDMRIGDILVDMAYIQPEDLTRALAEQFDMEIVDLESFNITSDVIELVTPELAYEHKIIPIELEDGILTVAMGDPLDLYTLDNLRFVINSQVEPVLATKDGINNALNRYYGMQEDKLDEMIQEFTQSHIEFFENEIDGTANASADDAPVIKLVTLIISEAVKQRASDIHIEPMTDRVRIRYRIDGQCIEVESPPKRLQGAILSRIKIMSKMDMAEKRRPQDGRIKLSLLGREIDLRVSALPASNGESVVMRILDKESVLMGMDQLGFHPNDYALFSDLIKRPNGIILVTGPTGSGKTTTLYAALNELNRSDCKIITAEDPVEYNISGINQCQVNRKAGMTFDIILRAMLRQAPNVILVGEIRDRETAEMAIQAALTGHLVFSTLHTNDAPSAITRLINMGVPPFLVASSIQAILAQRLVRVLCTECKVVKKADVPVLKSLGLREEQIRDTTFYDPVGCDNCKGRGFRGRRAIYETLVMNNRLREMAFNVEPTDQLRSQAIKDGMHTLLMDGVRKILEGITVPDEVLAVAKSIE
ncbi:MAG: Flp pilus assembly complex ATPase component TadA [Planctomycetes bacterium]|nr:Flp pilus assembly complex ATPase component TadA [Planctomycetota bacterium]